MIIVIAGIVLGLGYVLFKSSPESTRSTTQNPTNQTSSVTDHHSGSAMSADNDTLNALVGKPIPDIQLTDADGKTYTAADFTGKNTVLFFNEGLMCYPACWNQIASFGSDDRFNTDEIQAISVVADPAQDWQRAVNQMPQLAKATTLFDTNAVASRQLGLLLADSSMHKGSLPGHTYIIIDKEGIVRYVFDDTNMGMANDMLFQKIETLN